MQRNGGPILIIEDEPDLEVAVISLETDIRTDLEATCQLPPTMKALIMETRAAKRLATRTAHPLDNQALKQPNRKVKPTLDEYY